MAGFPASLPRQALGPGFPHYLDSPAPSSQVPEPVPREPHSSAEPAPSSLWRTHIPLCFHCTPSRVKKRYLYLNRMSPPAGGERAQLCPEAPADPALGSRVHSGRGCGLFLSQQRLAPHVQPAPGRRAALLDVPAGPGTAPGGRRLSPGSSMWHREVPPQSGGSQGSVLAQPQQPQAFEVSKPEQLTPQILARVWGSTPGWRGRGSLQPQG